MLALADAGEACALRVAAERIQVSPCPRETRSQPEREGEQDSHKDEQRHARNVDAGDIAVAIRQYRCRDLAAAREDDHSAAVYRERSEGGDDRWNPKDGHEQGVQNAERASDRTSDEEHKEDRPIGMMLQPFGRDECARRDDGANREIHLPGHDDESFAEGTDAYG